MRVFIHNEEGKNDCLWTKTVEHKHKEGALMVKFNEKWYKVLNGNIKIKDYCTNKFIKLRVQITE
jgi:hypothetical protein